MQASLDLPVSSSFKATGMRLASGPYFCFTIDTEPDDLWVYSRTLTFEHFHHLLDFHYELSDHGCKPVYLTTSEVAEHKPSARVMSKILDSGSAEIGAHFHSWTREWPFEHPPLGMPPLMAMAHRLGQRVEEQMLSYTCQTLEQAFGVRPVSYRGGRWSLNGDSVRSLANCGIHVDTTITPGRAWLDDSHPLVNGSDYRGFPRNPFYLRKGSLDVHFDGGDVLEFPVGASPAGNGAISARNAVGNALRSFAGRPRKANNWLWLRPTSQTTPQLRSCVDSLHEDGIPVWVAMIHSSEIIPCYKLPEKSDVNAFRKRCLDLVDYASSKGAIPITLDELGAIYGRATQIHCLDVR